MAVYGSLRLVLALVLDLVLEPGSDPGSDLKTGPWIPDISDLSIYLKISTDTAV